MGKPKKGDNFVHEKTGSATMINLDGKWKHDFADDNTPAGKKKKQTPTRPIKERNTPCDLQIKTLHTS